jgi:hypothetical protein
MEKVKNYCQRTRSDGEKRVRNLSNAIENVTGNQMTALLDLLEHLTVDTVLETKLVR